MESSDGERFVDHRETVIRAPRPRQLNALKVDITSPEDIPNSESLEAVTDHVPREVQVSVMKSSEDNQDGQGAAAPMPTKQESGGEGGESSFQDESVILQESSSSESKASSSKTVKMYATTVYTQRISGRKPRSSDSGGDISSPSAGTSAKASGIRQTTPTAETLSPTKICSVHFDVAAGVGCSTTTAFSKMFTKTVETSAEVSVTERHLSECSISVGGRVAKGHNQEAELNSSADSTKAAGEEVSHEAENQQKENDQPLCTELSTTVKSEEEKEVAEYSPGLAIRNLTLEDLQEKRFSPERNAEVNNTPIQVTDMSTTSLAAQPSLTQEKRFFSSYGDTAGRNISMPVSQDGVLSSEHCTSQLLGSESSTSNTTSAQTSGLTSGGQILMQCTEESATSLRKPLFNPIEVERKFTMTENVEEHLRSLGARLNKEKTFTDIYYDNEEFALIVADCWLRRRNDSWEAKVPLKSQDTKAIFSPASQYKEINNERDISIWLVDQLGLETWMRGDPIDLLIQAAELTEFAKFTTTRRSYTLPSCTVDLDLTDNGFQVGEIDVMAASPEELPQALHTIGNVAEQLGMQCKNQPSIQLIVFLLLFNIHTFNFVISSLVDFSVT